MVLEGLAWCCEVVFHVFIALAAGDAAAFCVLDQLQQQQARHMFRLVCRCAALLHASKCKERSLLHCKVSHKERCAVSTRHSAAQWLLHYKKACCYEIQEHLVGCAPCAQTHAVLVCCSKLQQLLPFRLLSHIILACGDADSWMLQLQLQSSHVKFCEVF